MSIVYMHIDRQTDRQTDEREGDLVLFDLTASECYTLCPLFTCR